MSKVRKSVLRCDVYGCKEEMTEKLTSFCGLCKKDLCKNHTLEIEIGISMGKKSAQRFHQRVVFITLCPRCFTNIDFGEPLAVSILGYMSQINKDKRKHKRNRKNGAQHHRS